MQESRHYQQQKKKTNNQQYQRISISVHQYLDISRKKQIPLSDLWLLEGYEALLPQDVVGVRAVQSVPLLAVDHLFNFVEFFSF
jgi:hypothetical protein